MVVRSKKMRIVTLIMAVAMLLSMSMQTFAIDIPEDVVDAKDELATVDIYQYYNNTQINQVVHNYATDGIEVDIDYTATLEMTEEMATYLQFRQSQLMNAKFNVYVNIDTTDKRDTLEFAGAGETITVTFSSSFLKPWKVTEADLARYPSYPFDTEDIDEYSYVLTKYEGGLFYYDITVNKAWAQSELEANDCIVIPMELIVYYDKDTKTAYGYEELLDDSGKVKAEFRNETPLFIDYSVNDWMKPINVEVADLRVKDEVDETVTFDVNTWRRVIATGTIDGIFSYERAHKISTLSDYDYVADINTLEFGNSFVGDDNAVIEEWTSNEVWVYLIRFVGGIDEPDSPFLNLEDHFAYIIGYPDGNVKPQGNITRAEVATIFFRMLTDEVRNEFWSQTNPYNDVKMTDWFNNAISTLTNLGVVNGYTDGGFHPNAKITRAEFATMAVRFFLITEEMYGEITEDAFSDIANHWANKYINMAYLLEIVDGYPDGTYRPNKVITRAEAMTIVNNTLRRAPCVAGIEPVEEHEDFLSWPDNMDKSQWYYAAVQEATNSHVYTNYADAENAGKELWTDILPVRDWAAFEKAWSDANSAYNPGEVVDGK